jgi:hypothetical protein
MQKYPLIGISIIAVVLIVLGSLTNVMGYQTVQSSNQKVINTEVDQKELLFQTIVDLANNKEIQKIILNSEMIREGFFEPGIRYSVFTPQILTKKLLNNAYRIGVIFSKTFCPLKIHSVLAQNQVNNQWMRKEINAVIEKDVKLEGEITQLSNSKCDCENENTTRWSFPVLCLLLYPFFMIGIKLLSYPPYLTIFGIFILEILGPILEALDCSYW